jgi:peroxiredoxin Q/BCP
LTEGFGRRQNEGRCLACQSSFLREAAMKPLTFAIALFVLGFGMNAARAIDVGEKAPSFETKDDQGKVWKSSDHIGKGVLVVYFYPAAMTGGCTKQACAFRDDMKVLQDKGIEVVGVSGDEVANLKFFKDAHELNFTLLSDENGEIAKAFGVPMRKKGAVYHANFRGKSADLKRGVTESRWTFVIDKEGKIISKNTKVNPANDSKDVLKAVESKKSV